MNRGIALEGRELLTALADEYDALLASNEDLRRCEVHSHAEFNALGAERDRYWNLAEQLGEALDHALAFWHSSWGNGTFYEALAAFTAEKDSRDV